MTTQVLAPEGAEAAPDAIIIKDGGKAGRVLVYLFVIVPFLALLASIPLALHGWINWQSIVIGVVFYCITNFGVGAGFHRGETHLSYHAVRLVRDIFQIAGSMALEGSVTSWVAIHRRHHLFSDHEGDPHSPWRYGTRAVDIAKGAWYAHVGWLFGTEAANPKKYAKDLLADKHTRVITSLFPVLTAVSLLLPALLGYLWTGMSWKGALIAFFWASLVRICVMHHVTWSINSVCHLWGDEPFTSKDKSRNVWWLAILSFGESWHNYHHSDPTMARHGANPGELDANARLIKVLELLHLVSRVRWPSRQRVQAKRVTA